MQPLVIDVETTTLEKGNPYVAENKLCYVGAYNGEMLSIKTKDHYPFIDKLLIGFNLKFDLSWLRRYDIDFSSCSVWVS